MHDQHRFAELSGDWNPLHIDPLIARRSILGGVAVHGIHIVLWAFDVLAAGYNLRGFSRLRVQFERGVVVGDTVEVTWDRQADRLLGIVSGVAGTSVRISLVPANPEFAVWHGSQIHDSRTCHEYDMSALENKTGELSVTLPKEWEQMFPNLAGSDSGTGGRFLPALVAVLLGTTRLVGMFCPGLHSIYSSIDLGADPATPPTNSLRYEVIRADPRVRLIEMAVRTGGVHGKIGAFLRPKPYAQKSMLALRDAVAANEFAGREAIVIGGSRGLGELTAKLLALGGANVTITWKQGEREAQAIAAEAAALGIHIRVQHFDATAPPFDELTPPTPYTHLHYFATPRIPAGRPGQFNAALFEMLLGSYATGVARTAAWFAPRAIANACFWYPSTVFVEQPDPNFAEYAAAKACGEALCAQLSVHMAPLRFKMDRLRRLPTDQSRGLTSVDPAESEETLIALLR